MWETRKLVNDGQASKFSTEQLSELWNSDTWSSLEKRFLQDKQPMSVNKSAYRQFSASSSFLPMLH